MKRRAFTLTELVIAMVLSGILVIAMACQFITLGSFTRKVGRGLGSLTGQERPTAVREARIVTHHMGSVLRFIVSSATSPAFISNSSENRITATIKGGRINLLPNDAECYYRLDKRSPNNYKFYFSSAPGVETLLSGAVTSFSTDNAGNAIWDPVASKLILKLDFTDSQTTVPVETAIKVLGDK